jgi:hypothetical protein
MSDGELELKRDSLIRIVTEVYAMGNIELPVFEKAVARLHSCTDLASLESEASLLGLARSAEAALPREADVLELSCVSGHLRKDGDWAKGGRCWLSLRSSTAKLDLMEYEGRRGFRLAIDIDAVSSSVSLVVPADFVVEDRISERSSSTVRNRPRDAGAGSVVILTGRLRSSTIKVKYR